MNAVKITENFDDLTLVEQLAKEAFPPEEYLSPAELIRMSRKGQLDFWSLYDKIIIIHTNNKLWEYSKKQNHERNQSALKNP